MSLELRQLPDDLRRRYLEDGSWSDESLGDLVDRSLRAATRARIRIWSDRRPWTGTYSDVHDEALRLVAGLRERGIAPGSVVAFQIPNWREAVVAFYGLALGGYVLVPIVHIYGRREVEFILRQCGAVAYLSAASFGHVDYCAIIDAIGSDLADLRFHVVVDGGSGSGSSDVERIGWDEFVSGAIDDSGPVSVDPDEVVVLAFTSGTTNVPKGVVHTHRTLLAELAHMAPWMGEPNLMGSPVTHATGMLGAVLAPVQLGQDIHLIDRWDPDRVLEIMLEAGIGAGTGAPVFLASLLYHPDFTDEHSDMIKQIGLGGAPVPVSLAETAASRGILLIRAYGSTEHPSVTGCTFDQPVDKRHSTDGRPLAGVEIRIVDEAKVDVEPGTAGEILSRGPDLCMGYTDTSLTAAMFDDEGWYQTGDMAVMDEEGFVTITDRVADVIIRGGENISAVEVEEAMMRLPGVAEVAVVAARDERLGEHACAFVRLVDPETMLTLETVIGHLGDLGLTRQKWPEELRLVSEFSRTATGKIRKVDLRAQFDG